MSSEVTIDSNILAAIIGSLISAIFAIVGIFVVLKYNKKAIDQNDTVIEQNTKALEENTRTRYYQIIKDADERFYQIDLLKSLDVNEHYVALLNFGIFLKSLVVDEMIPKKIIIDHYRYVFRHALWVANRSEDNIAEDIRPTLTQLIQFCKDNDIHEIDPKIESKLKKFEKK